LVLTGGGSGGHLYPALSIAQALCRSADSCTPVFIGTRTGIEAQVVPGEGFEFHAIISRKVTRSFSPVALLSAASITWGAVQAGLLLRRIAPVAVVGTGGYASAGVVLAAALQGIPTLIHEQNSIPGRTNRLLSRIVRRVALSFPDSVAFFPARKTIVTGLPVRPEVAQGDRERAYTRFGLSPDQRTLLVLGGSRGAQSLNRAVRDALPLLSNSGLQILHQVGRANWDEHQAVLDNAPTWYHSVPYLEAMGDAYTVADLVCGRAGASTLAELALVGLPSLLVPYPHAHADHQTQNARCVAAAGAAALVPDVEFSGHRLVAEAEALFAQPDRLAEMSRASRSLGRPDAAEAILGAVWEMIGTQVTESNRSGEHGTKRGAA
jgi:UDP-N-acetylglucosamine--N-acetylmuramyl-(pentapeptide) pyrophosphoryl-undecaprenol N-acetylglucosamine transferase